jgi:hypothetical protein
LRANRGTRTVVHSAAAAVGWVVLATGDDPGTSALQVPTQLTRNGFSVLEVVLPKRCPAPVALGALRDAEASIRHDNPGNPVLLGGVRETAPLAARLAAEVDAAGLISVDGPLLSIAWRMPSRQTTTLLLASTGASAVAKLGLRASGTVLGRQARVVTSPEQSAVDRAIRGWQRAAEAGGWPDRAPSAISRLAVPTAAVLGLGAGAAMLGAAPVAAAQRSGDGVAAPAGQALAKTNSLGGQKVGAGQRQGDGVRPHATGSAALEDGAGMKWFVNTDITFSTTSSASAAMSEASYQQPVTASTLNGGTTQAQLNDAYDGYNSLWVSLNGTFCHETGNANCVAYNKNGVAPAATCTGQGLNFPVQSVDGLNVSRRVFVPTNDHFERTLNVFTNPGTTPITTTISTGNNLGSDNNTVITGTSNGTDTAADGDKWVTTFQNFSGTTSSDPRLGHVLQGAGAAVGSANVTFNNGDDNPTWGYTFTVAPGQTLIIANFAVADGTIAASQADSARLAALPPNAIQCMSSTDLSELANFVPPAPPAPPTPPPPSAKSGYWLADASGGVQAYGVPFEGSLPGLGVKPAAPIVGVVADPSGKGYWLVGSDGGVYAFGDAKFEGSAAALRLSQPVVGMAATADGGGYWLVGADGGVFAYGDAAYEGSATSLHLSMPVTGIAGTGEGGYLLVGADGGVFAYGDAAYEGSAATLHLTKPIAGIAATSDGGGYWLVGADGGVFNYGDARFSGSMGGKTLTKPIDGIAAAGGSGYWLVGSDGGVFAFGGAVFNGAGNASGGPVNGLAGG